MKGLMPSPLEYIMEREGEYRTCLYGCSTTSNTHNVMCHNDIYKVSVGGTVVGSGEPQRHSCGATSATTQGHSREPQYSLPPMRLLYRELCY